MDFTTYQMMLDQTLFVLVLYKMPLYASSSFTSLTEALQCNGGKADLLVYDNSPISNVQDDQLNHPNWRIHYIHNAANPGVSMAYNTGGRLGANLEKQWLFLLDQDTEFRPNSLSKYFCAILDYPQIKLFAPRLITKNQRDDDLLLSPCKYYLKRGFVDTAKSRIAPGLVALHHRSLLNSGMLINLLAFEHLGGYDEKVKLDFSDFKFIDKYKKQWSTFVLVDTDCLQKFSNIEDDLTKSVQRFCYYCSGARNSAENVWELIVLLGVVSMRCAVLSLRFRTYQFVAVLGRSYLLKQEC